jgi:hypothetical protein
VTTRTGLKVSRASFQNVGSPYYFSVNGLSTRHQTDLLEYLLTRKFQFCVERFLLTRSRLMPQNLSFVAAFFCFVEASLSGRGIFEIEFTFFVLRNSTS